MDEKLLRNSYTKPSPAADLDQTSEIENGPLQAIQQAIRSIRFGIVQVTIQDGRVVQIDKTEKIRLV